MLKTAEALIASGPHGGTWQPLPDLPEPRCAHAMVQTYRKKQKWNQGTLWLPNIYVIGGCSGKGSPGSARDKMYAWPPEACLSLSAPQSSCDQGSNSAGQLLTSVVYLELPPADSNNPPILPNTKAHWQKGPDLNTARGGHNLSAVVFGDYIYVFGGTGTGCPINGPRNGCDPSGPCGSGNCCTVGGTGPNAAICPRPCGHCPTSAGECPSCPKPEGCAWKNKSCHPGECWNWKTHKETIFTKLTYGTPYTGTVTLMRDLPLDLLAPGALCIIGNANWVGKSDADDYTTWLLGQDAAVLCDPPPSPAFSSS